MKKFLYVVVNLLEKKLKKKKDFGQKVLYLILALNLNIYPITRFYHQQKIMKSSRKNFRFLVVGRMGEGKSELCKYLTGCKEIAVSDDGQSCTRNCSLYSSTKDLKLMRAYDIEAIDTPGLDSNHENVYNMIKELTQIFDKNKQINGILYVCSMVHDRNETIKWFHNFLKIFFTQQQLRQGFIPILTNYDGVLQLPLKKRDSKKLSRKNVLKKIFEDNIQQIWNNHIQWINDVDLEQEDKQKFKKISDFQLQKLLHKTQNICIDIEKNSENFYKHIVDKTLIKLQQGNNISFDTIEQQIRPNDIKMGINEIPFKMKLLNLWKFIRNGLKIQQKYQQSKVHLLGQDEFFHETISKLIECTFWNNFNKKFVEIKQQKGIFWNSLKIDINSNKKEVITVVKLLCEKIPQNPGQKVKIVKYEPGGKIYFQEEGVYSFYNITIRRPSDRVFEKAFEQFIKSQD